MKPYIDSFIQHMTALAQAINPSLPWWAVPVAALVLLAILL